MRAVKVNEAPRRDSGARAGRASGDKLVASKSKSKAKGPAASSGLAPKRASSPRARALSPRGKRPSVPPAPTVRAPLPLPPAEDLLSLLLGPPPEALAHRKAAAGKGPETEHARRARVIDVANELFAKNGPTRTTISDVCRAAQITHSVFYGMFGTKEGLFDEIGEARRREAEPMVVPIFEERGTVREKLKKLIETYLGQLAARWRDFAPTQIELIAESVHNPEIRAILRKRRGEMNAKMRLLIEEGQRAGEIDAALDSVAVVDVLGSLFIGMQVTRLMDPEFDHARYAVAADSLVMGVFWRYDGR